MCDIANDVDSCIDSVQLDAPHSLQSWCLQLYNLGKVTNVRTLKVPQGLIRGACTKVCHRGRMFSLGSISTVRIDGA